MKKRVNLNSIGVYNIVKSQINNLDREIKKKEVELTNLRSEKRERKVYLKSLGQERGKP